jgi:hypothetical protein
MARLKGSVNKRILFSSIDTLNIQLIYHTEKLDSFKLEPDHWLYRLKEISGNLPYIITLHSKVSMNDFVFSNYVDANLEYINQNEGLGFITKPGFVPSSSQTFFPLHILYCLMISGVHPPRRYYVLRVSDVPRGRIRDSACTLL